MAKIRVGVLGFGFIGDLHAKAVVNCPDTELAGLWTRREETAAKFRELYPDARVYDSPEEMAADESVNAVAVGLPNRMHHPQTILFLEAGKHVLVEKPMALDVAQAVEMAESARANERVLMVGHMWRFDREVKAVRELVAGDSIGRIVKTKGYGIHESWGPSGWFADKELAGGGALVDMGVHAIDTVRFLMGDPEPVSVYARIGTHYGSYEVDDTGILVINWDNDVTSLIESGWWQPHMDGPEASTQLFGTRGYARVFPTMAKFGAGRAPWLPRFPARESHCDQHIYDHQMQEFADSIREKRRPVPGAPEGIAVLKICEAAYESARSGAVVPCR